MCVLHVFHSLSLSGSRTRPLSNFLPWNLWNGVSIPSTSERTMRFQMQKKRIRHAQKYQTIQFNVVLYVYVCPTLRYWKRNRQGETESSYCISAYSMFVARKSWQCLFYAIIVARLSFSHLFVRCNSHGAWCVHGTSYMYDVRTHHPYPPFLIRLKCFFIRLRLSTVEKRSYRCT